MRNQLIDAFYYNFPSQQQFPKKEISLSTMNLNQTPLVAFTSRMLVILAMYVPREYLYTFWLRV